MKGKLLFLSIFSLLFLCGDLFAQQPDIEMPTTEEIEMPTEDSVWMEGRVTDALSGKPKQGCEVQLLRAGEYSAVATLCDSDGYFSIGWMPVGNYTLSVVSEGKSLYYTELELTQSAMINIALMPDTVNSRVLNPAEITASRIKPVYVPITSPDDPRLWNWQGLAIMMDSGPASSAFGTPHGRAPFFKPGSLASWRPAWLDAPFETKTITAGGRTATGSSAHAYQTETKTE